jgi:hypothetical protein
VACVLGLREISARDPDWPVPPGQGQGPGGEQSAVSREELIALERAVKKFHADSLRLLLVQRPERRDPDEVQRALDGLAIHKRRFREAAERLAALGTVEPKRAEKERTAALDYFRLRARLMESIERHLKEQRGWNAKNELQQETAEAQVRWYDSSQKER